ncbi:MAG: NAD(P)H-hydrate dehydratase [Lachnospiraceae bacterium]|nr:NAD(P)H-hydrate dehydratase [Lachnospiraceae bacterium]
MDYILNAAEAAEIDRISIYETGIPSVVLMEKAAMAVARHIQDICSTSYKDMLPGSIKVLAVCGMGNNGGDGIACARILKGAGFNASIFIAGDKSKATEETKRQLNIAHNLDVPFITKLEDNEYNIIIDAMFGTGLSRDIGGKYAELADWINCQSSEVIAVDIPSGINADNGQVYGCAVKASHTVTFGSNKRGTVLFPGASYSGNVVVADIGFPEKAVHKAAPGAYTYRKEDLPRLMPERLPRSNKGSFGKVLIIAGSAGMSGACILAAKAAARAGCGIVKIATAPQNTDIIKTCLPEAITGTYADGITESIKWADVVAIGPGLGTDGTAKKLVEEVLKIQDKPVVMDADALNILSKLVPEGTGIDRYKLAGNFVITPHIKEMSRLSGAASSEIQENIIDYASGHKSGCTIVLKDARTVVSDGSRIYINTTGNNALSTAGSGDVLCGIITGLLAQGMELMEAASLAVLVHGITADVYAENKNRYSMLASDIIEELQFVLPY